MESPVYEVNVASFGTLWFHEDDYMSAYHHVTGHGIDEWNETDENEIRIVEFDGVVGVPVANV